MFYLLNLYPKIHNYCAIWSQAVFRNSKVVGRPSILPALHNFFGDGMFATQSGILPILFYHLPSERSLSTGLSWTTVVRNHPNYAKKFDQIFANYQTGCFMRNLTLSQRKTPSSTCNYEQGLKTD